MDLSEHNVHTLPLASGLTIFIHELLKLKYKRVQFANLIKVEVITEQ